MGLFGRADRSRKSAPRKSAGKAAPAAAAAPVTPRPRRRIEWKRALRYAGLLLAGIAAMAGVGYLVAAIWLFPAPLLPSERVVPRVIGLSENEAQRQLERLGFPIEELREPHVTAGPGLVTWQDPPPGVAASTDTRVAISISSGAPRARIPDVRGMTLPMAERLLAAVGLRVEGVDTATAKAQLGTAAGTTPPIGDSVAVGRGVIVHIVR